MRTPLIVGNWKMHTTRSEALGLGEAVAAAAKAAPTVDVGVAPPSIWAAGVRDTVGDAITVFGQNVNEHASGAHTGELSAGMLVDAGLGGTLVGHSERRHVYGESDATVAAKVTAAREAGLTVILCVGETLAEREAEETWAVVERQLSTGLASLASADGIVVAYEPVWAIGTGKTATSDQAQAVHARIRAWFADRFDASAAAALRIQYGGSVKPGNAAELLGMPDIDGALVGGASLTAESFAAIIEAARP